MYYIRDISVGFGERQLLDTISFMISPKDKIGLIGRNGAGKSTLLKIIAGLLRPDHGMLEFPSKTTVGYLRQEFELNESLTVLEETMSCHSEAVKVQQRLDELHAIMGETDDFESQRYHRMVEEISDLSLRLEHIQPALLEIETLKVLKGLGFVDDDLEKRISTLSGGWKMRIELAKLLVTMPDILLLDEPTNHLDIESIIWLEEYLSTYAGTVIVISHDTQFLDNVCNRIIEVESGRITDMKLSYQKFVTEKAKLEEMQAAAFENQQKVIAQKEKTINRFMAKATKTKMAQSMQKQLEKMDRIEMPLESSKNMTISFSEVPRSGRNVFTGVDVAKSYGIKEVFNQVSFTLERGDRVAFVGQNGQGKTTMAKIIAGVIAADGGSMEMGANVQMSYYAQNQSELLDLKKTVLEVMEDKAPEHMRSRVRSILGSFLFSGEDVDKKVSVLSGGERARLAMASLMMKPCNFLILDEPTNHLDIYSKQVLKDALLSFEGTLLVISHDRAFLSGLTSKIIEYKSGRIREYLGDIEYFLEKKKLTDMRSLELDNNPNMPLINTSIEVEAKPIDGEEYRRLRKVLQQTERQIEQLEKSLKEIELEMSSQEFYLNQNFSSIQKKYSELREELDRKMLVWEETAVLLEN